MESNLPFLKYVIVSSGNREGKIWGNVDGIRDDAPQEMKDQFWKWIAFRKECDLKGIRP